MKRKLFLLSVIILLISCSKENEEIPQGLPIVTITPPSGGFVIDKMQWLRIQPQIISTEDVTCSWWLDGEEIADTQNLLHIFAEAGNYNLTFKASNSIGESFETIIVTINNADYRGSGGRNAITRVFEFLPAPGQFVNKMPEATDGDTPETMRQKAEDALTNGGMISLGGFGGYVVFGFDHTVMNREGNDFIVLGNAFANWAEPGVIMVAYDADGTGFPDENTEWFEIAGSEYHASTTIKNYEITYFRPESEPENPNEPNYIFWTDNQGQEGYISKNQFHRQTYFPLWAGNSYTLRGTFMESLIHDTSGNGTMWVNPAFGWGYADNWTNNDVRAQIDIDWAVDKTGNPVKLKGIDFVRVHTGQRAEGGWLGEVSTEVSGFTNLNLH